MTVERGHRAWQVHPDGHLTEAGLAADLAEVAAGGGGPVFVWVSNPTEVDDELATAAGLALGRDLHELRIPLPAESTDLEWRPFRPGDEAEWVEVNNRAFSWHPEQGGWTVELLRERLAEPWVDLDGFLVHERDGRMAGFCWTKVHADHDPVLGEIYVIAADPDFHGLGLGKALTLAGLQWLHDARGITVGNLYVDATNTAAVNLYAKLGFTLHHVDRAYSGDIPPAAP
jgi:mycothiol synthase